MDCWTHTKFFSLVEDLTVCDPHNPCAGASLKLQLEHTAGTQSRELSAHLEAVIAAIATGGEAVASAAASAEKSCTEGGLSMLLTKLLPVMILKLDLGRILITTGPLRFPATAQAFQMCPCTLNLCAYNRLQQNASAGM